MANDAEPAEGPQHNAAESDGESHASPDVYLDVPVVKVDQIDLEVEDLRARVSLQAGVLELLNLNVGVDVHLGRVKLDIKGVEAQALLKVRLDNVRDIIDSVLTTIDRNPQIIENVSRGVESAAKSVGSGADRAAGELGRGAGDAVKGTGEGAGDAVKNVGEGAGDTAKDAGEGVAGTVDDLGEAVKGGMRRAEQSARGLARAPRQAAKRLGRSVGGLDTVT